MPGPAPKQPSKRRRYNTPKSYGATAPVTAPAASDHDRELGIDGPVHSLVERMWSTLQTSAESRFFSTADWERARFELFYANELFTGRLKMTSVAWNAVQHGLGALLVSPAEKRRCGVEVRPTGPDADQDAALVLISRYQEKLASPPS